MPSCSVIIAGYDTGSSVFAAVKSGLMQEGLAGVVVVDHGGTPDMLARLQQMALSEPKLNILAWHGKKGLASVYNLGVKSAVERYTSEYFAFLRPDCLLAPGALKACIDALEHAPGAMLAGGMVIDPDGSIQNPPDSKLSDQAVLEMPSLSSAYLMARAGDFHFFGGFDEGFAYHEVVNDLCRRARSGGKKLLYVKGARVTQVHDQVHDPLAPENPWNKTKDSMRYYTKHYRGRYFPGDAALMRVALRLRHVVQGTARPHVNAMLRRRQKLAYLRLKILASGWATLPETKKFAGKTVFVTGATSEMGLCVVRRLMAAGASVLALSRGEPIPFEHVQLRWIRDDLDNEACTLHGYYADMAVHCAPLHFLAKAVPMLKESGVTRLVAFSSALAAARIHTQDMQEWEYLKHLNESEQAAREACEEQGLALTIFRPSFIYGTGLDRGVTALYQWVMKRGFVPVYPPALGRCHPVHADDMAIAVVQVLENPITHGKQYNISGGEILTCREIIERVFALAKKPVRIVEWSLMPYMLDWAGRVFQNPNLKRELAYRMNENLLFFHDAAREDFAYHPRAFLSGGLNDVGG